MTILLRNPPVFGMTGAAASSAQCSEPNSTSQVTAPVAWWGWWMAGRPGDREGVVEPRQGGVSQLHNFERMGHKQCRMLVMPK